jgi:serine/threonine-protein kinase PpkA
MQVPGFEIERRVAKGGMSTVYRAVQASLGRPVALKVLKHIDSLQQAERFLREARIVAALEHRNIVTIHDVGSVGERYYIAMEFLEGGSLADRIEHGLPEAQALELLEAIAGCLDFVHRRGVVHRDIKPGNILFHADGTAKLSDFGIAQELQDDQDGTMEGNCFGSPYYLSPEQAEGRPLDGRSDIYSLGILFYQMLTGKRPYAERSHIETIVAHLSQPIPVLPRGLERYQRLLEGMIAKDPADRIASAAELLERVRTLRAPEATSAAPGADSGARAATPRAGRAHLPVALLSLAGAAGIAWWLLGGEPAPAPTMAETTPPPALPKNLVAAVAPTSREPLVEATAAAEPAPQAEPDRGIETAVTAPAGEPPAGAEQAATETETETAPVTAEAAPEPLDTGRESPERPDRQAQADADVAADDEETAIETAPATDPSEVATVEAAATAEPVDPGAARIDALIRQAEADLQALRLTRPAGNSAHDRYREVLDLEPGHPGALSGIDSIAARYAAMTEKALAEGDRKRAELYLRRGLQVQPGHPALAAAAETLKKIETPPAEVAPALVEATVEQPEESLRGPGSGNIVKDFQKLWRAVFD